MDSTYCSGCLEMMSNVEAGLKKNRCSTCKDCPSCGHTLSTRATSIQVNTVLPTCRVYKKFWPFYTELQSKLGLVAKQQVSTGLITAGPARTAVLVLCHLLSEWLLMYLWMTETFQGGMKHFRFLSSGLLLCAAQ